MKIEKINDAELATLRLCSRNALTAHVFNGQKYVAIAADQNIPLGTVKSRINRARLHILALRDFKASQEKPPGASAAA
jgi:DNA-directed RNA polymerase specialized sigma24 family protein